MGFLRSCGEDLVDGCGGDMREGVWRRYGGMRRR